ncbi:hypothetical protein HWV62_38967 [Athelia sp. TMB]|nr:hypothetical protein HWV62_38967 [Athelia sp. TMB]
MSIFYHQDCLVPRSPSLESFTSVSSALSSDQDIETMDHLSTTMPPTIITNSTAVAGGRGDLPPVEEMMETIIKAWQQQKQRNDILASAKSPSVSNAGAHEISSPTSPSFPAYEKHERFYLPVKHIYFLINSTIYSVPRAPFDAQSVSFVGKGLAEHEPLVLEDVTTAQFDHFLSILYPSEYGVYTATSVEDWSVVLRLADSWDFKSIRALAIKQLAPIATAIDKIVLGKRYKVDEWLFDGYYAVCARHSPLTEEEGDRLSNRDVVRIFTTRETLGIPKGLASIPSQEIYKRFDLPMAMVASSLPPTENVKAIALQPRALGTVTPFQEVSGPIELPAAVVTSSSPTGQSIAPAGFDPLNDPAWNYLTPKERKRRQKEVKDRIEREQREKELADFMAKQDAELCPR